MEIKNLYQLYLKYPLISTDSRSAASEGLYFALKGENFNGNNFAFSALENGAKKVIVDEIIKDADDRFILVDNVLETLQELAKHHRGQLNIPVIGITGSNGKTTSKELLNAVLSKKFKTFATKGNLNNHIGVPLSILSISSAVEIAIVEMGANHQKEIEFLCSICKPNFGFITNVGKAHLEGFGGIAGVKKGKKELYDFLLSVNGLTFIKQPNEDLAKMASEITNKKTYGEDNSNDYIGSCALINGLLKVNWKIKETNSTETFEIQSNLTGLYNFDNIMAAIAIGTYFKLLPEEIKAGIENYFPENNRSQKTMSGDRVLIKDYYNANPSSMLAALENLNSMKNHEKIAVLGDMFELGIESFSEHLSIIQMAQKLNLSQLIFIGDRFFEHRNLKNSSTHFYQKTSDLKDKIQTIIPKKALILIKGSRGIKLENLADLL